jgi:hypothetical protein
MSVMRRVVGWVIKKGRGGVWTWKEENKWNCLDPDKGLSSEELVAEVGAQYVGTVVGTALSRW